MAKVEEKVRLGLHGTLSRIFNETNFAMKKRWEDNYGPRSL
jgi:hypothetical protein